MNNDSAARLAEGVRGIVEAMLNGNENSISNACLYHATVMHVLTGCPIVGGSYSWKFTNVDDGKNPTHYSCIFDEAAQREALAYLSAPAEGVKLRHLPEMHVWNMSRGVVFDCTTIYVARNAAARGVSFDPKLLPPDFLFGKPAHRNQRWVYEPNRLATTLAQFAAKTVINDYGLKAALASKIPSPI